MNHQYIFEPPRYNYNDYKNWKEDWELVNGYPMQMLPSPAADHSKVLVNFITQGKNALKSNLNCACTLFTELDWKISDETVVRPDMMIVCNTTNADYLEFPPVLILEIVSPNNIKRDRVIKFELYREQGVQYYIMADYLKKTVEVYELVDNFYKQKSIKNFKLDQSCEIQFDFNDIWD
jgi:Uma2 family endonuclease